MKNPKTRTRQLFVGLAALLMTVSTFGEPPPDPPPRPDVPSDLPMKLTKDEETGEVRWTTYFVSTNEFAGYLHKDFTFESEVPLSDEFKQKIQTFFKSEFKKTYDVLALTSKDEDRVYDLINHAYHRRLLFATYQEYMETLTELERMGSHIRIEDVGFRRITVKRRENNRLTVEVVWTLDALLHHVTHNHKMQNVNCVQFVLEVSDDGKFRIISENIISIDRINIYQ